MSDNAAVGFLIILVSLVLYFLPTIIARSANHRQLTAIFALNLLLGWTILGWVAALVWALVK
jgi:T4 superinfection immunity protein